MTDNVALTEDVTQCCNTTDGLFSPLILVLCCLLRCYDFRTKVLYGSYRQHPHARNILRLECEGAVDPGATFLASLEGCFLLPLTNVPFLIPCISGRQITAVLFKLGDLCQIPSAEDLAAFLSVSLSREDTFL